MKNLINKIGVLTLIFSFILVSCETVDFGDENVNPNSPTSKKTDALLTNAMTWMPNIVSPVTPNIMFKLYLMLHIHHIQDTTQNNGHGTVIILDHLKTYRKFLI